MGTSFGSKCPSPTCVSPRPLPLQAWIRTMLLTAALFPLTCFAISFVLNTIAIGYHSLAAAPFGSIVVLVLIWALVSVPLCLLGTVIGRNWNGQPDNPCRVKRIPSPIPQKKVRGMPWTLICKQH